ncbi:hypothetical protein [Pseudomonas fluorescens]|jgi:hypothetical protein|uniref:hypothetical protein n=1 Tax=Pseudomonas fluorescens TaxID=294 RepID=UPI00277FAB19|nr:hypothetical protein [Pseudomonas fluorescens]MDP9785612.1 hypothetical protein [Pseudomonas fluorescens]
MHETLKIKIDFAKERRRPAEVFQAMSSYIDAYQALGQVIAVSVGAADDFELRLEDVETGSIASLLKSVPGRVRSWVEDAVFDAGVKLAGELSEIDSTSTEEDVDILASKLEAQLSKLDLGQTVDPMIDRKALAIALSKFSEANKRLLPEESATATLKEAHCVTPINTHWRFNANPKDMFLGTKESHVGVDKLYVRAPVNIGKGAWAMLSVSTGSRYNANISDLAWLEGYQDGLIKPIGPKDVMEAEIAYEIYTPPAGKGKPFISSAKIKRVLDIHRDVGLQHEPRPLL